MNTFIVWSLWVYMTGTVKSVHIEANFPDKQSCEATRSTLIINATRAYEPNMVCIQSKILK